VGGGVFPATETIHFPKSCLHCEEPPCVPVCPTGASYKRKEDGIVLVDYDKCIGCKYCAWACPYGMREIDETRQVMTKCTLVRRPHPRHDDAVGRTAGPACVKACPTNARLFGDVKDPDSEVSKAIRERGGYELMPEWDTKPANRYLPRRPTAAVGADAGAAVRARPRRPLKRCGDEPGLLGHPPHRALGRGAGARGAARARLPRRRRASMRRSRRSPARAFAAALVLAAAALVASFFHLGRPERAWRAAAMWRTSWLSREVIALPAFIGATAVWWWGVSRGLPRRSRTSPGRSRARCSPSSSGSAPRRSTRACASSRNGRSR
jgi:Fe-S-cluster-containing dehydrogenase component